MVLSTPRASPPTAAILSASAQGSWMGCGDYRQEEISHRYLCACAYVCACTRMHTCTLQST